MPLMESLTETPERDPTDEDVRVAMKFRNGDVSLDEAVESILNSGEEFTMPNGDLLVYAATNTPWD